jgi:predicted lipid-binding transport protein (Tim44 family)
MKTAFLAALSLALAVTLAPLDTHAKRLGGGKSFGMQRNTPQRTAPDAPPAKPAAPAQQGAAGQQANPGQQAAPAAAPNAAAAQAAAPKRNWMGPLAGLAAGLGLAALMSHLGLGEQFASFLMIALLAMAALFVVRMLMARRSQAHAQAQGASLRAAGGAGSSGAQVAWPQAGTTAAAPIPPAAPVAPAEPAATPQPLSAVPAEAAEAADSAAALPRAFVPAAFDAEGFARTAKMIFIRLQAANDAGDLDDLRAFTTPEMFAELSMELRERGQAAQHTEVLQIDSEVLDVATEGARQVVSVRMRGQVREEAGAAAVVVDEVWHLVKPVDGSRNWAIAGIEQWQGAAAH